MSEAAVTAAPLDPVDGHRSPTRVTLAHAWRLHRTKLGLLLTALVVALALIGPHVAPHGSTEFVGFPYSKPSAKAPLGADYLGQDVLSRVLYGGESILWMAVAAVTLGCAVGVALGLVAGYSRNYTDDVIMRTLDIQLAFPGLVFVLLFVSLLGHHLWLIVLLVAFGNVPGIARITRGITTEAATREYVEAAEVLGVPRRRILMREILPNLATPLLVEYTLRLTWAIGAIAALSFLGFGVQPPATDWGLMINQNRNGLTINPWAIVVPILCIAVFTIGTNLMGEGLSRAVAGIDRQSGEEEAGTGRRAARSRRPARSTGALARPVPSRSLVEVRNLRVELTGSGHDVVDGISFSIDAGEVVGLVGESGSGKTTIGTALLGATRRGAEIVEGEIVIDGIGILDLTEAEMRKLRGSLVAYIPQDPTASLNPSIRIGRQLEEMLELHADGWGDEQRRARLESALAEVKLPATEEFLRRFPHQLSGGQQQRVAIAMAFILRPKLIVLDEPTTGLDVTTQAHVLETVRDLCDAHHVAGLYVTHDLAVVANLAHRVLVAYSGRLVELGSREDVFDRPVHPYTKRLLASIPVVTGRRTLDPIPGQAPPPGSRPPHCFFAPRCAAVLPVCTSEDPALVEVSDGHAALCFRANELFAAEAATAPPPRRVLAEDAESILAVRDLETFYGSRQILFDVSISLRPHECLALVGESGSGKTTLARSIIGLATKWNGEIAYKGRPLEHTARGRPASVRRELQYIFQSPYTSLNPRRSIEQSVGLPLRHFFGLKGRAAHERVLWALDAVSLPARYASRYPDQLSGGERQRVAIARALVCEPEVLICDEITSALDVSVQASIVRLLEQLQAEHGLALLFVTHNLALVRSVADRVVVMNRGRIVESGETDDVLDNPRDQYTRALLSDTPSLVTAGVV
jgi:peptide/nickel transport system ATP-binding protein